MPLSFDPVPHTHLLVLSGSRAYGLERPGSDVDVRGVIVPPKRFLYGLDTFEQTDDPVDTAPFLDDLRPAERQIAEQVHFEGVLTDLRKIVRLATDGNPAILDALFGRDDEVRRITPVGEGLRAMRGLMLTRALARPYTRYAAGQLDRLRTHRRWLALPADHPDRARHPAWTRPRDPARAALEAKVGYDTKAAMHLVRLLRTAQETLATGHVRVWRGDHDADELGQIRDGAWSWDTLEAWATDAGRAVEDAVATSPLPSAPDLREIERATLALLDLAITTQN